MTRLSTVMLSGLLAFSVVLIGKPPSEPPPAQDLVLHIDVNLVQIDAMVYDHHGNPVTDLKPEDFEILEDGKPQAITAFSYIRLNAGAVPSAGGKQLLTPAQPLTSQQVKRTIVLVADDLNLSFESTAHLHVALKKFIDTQMGPNDLVSIARTSTGLGALETFTNDKRTLYAAADAVRWNPNGRAGISAIQPIDFQTKNIIRPQREEREELRDTGEIHRDIVSIEHNYLYVEGTMNSVAAIIDNVRPLPGRKAVILFSDGLPVVPGTGGDNDLVERLLHRVADLANRSSVVLNTVDARGLQTLAGNANDQFGRGAVAEGVSETATARLRDFNIQQNGLVYLAGQTGGRAVLNGNDMTWAIDQVLDDLNGYYLIGYQPQPGTFHKQGDAPSFHQLRVRVKRPGLSVRSRTGFYGLTDQESLPQPVTDGQKLFTALQSPFGAPGIPLKLTVQFLSDGDKHSSLATLLHIDGHAIDFKKEEDDKYHARIELLLTGFDENGRAVEGANNILDMALPQAEYDAALANGFVYSQRVPIGRRGAAHVLTAVRDMNSGRLGSTSDFVLLPELKKQRMVLGTLTMGESKVSTGPANPASRVFKASLPLPYRFSILNPKLDGASMARVETQVRVFHDGKQVWASQPSETDGRMAKDARTLVASSALHLGADFGPGDYYLQVVAKDLLAGKRAAPQTQWIGFQLQPE